MEVVEQFCIKGFGIADEAGGYWKTEQGKKYTTSIPREGKEDVRVFSNYWVMVPKEHFVIAE